MNALDGINGASAEVDVLVVGGGNAALCAAIAARQRGCSVLIVEAAPRFYRGGNTRHTRNCRLAHDGGNGVQTGTYGEDEYWNDLLRVTDGETDEELARYTIGQSSLLMAWLSTLGVRFQGSFGGTLGLSHSNAFFLGGGRAMLNALYRTATGLGVDVRYEHEMVGLEAWDGAFRRAEIRTPQGGVSIAARALVVAAGGFEANLEWLAEYWGAAAANFAIRGTPYNRGSMLRLLLDNDVAPVGDPTQCHAVAVDARGPRFDGGIVTRLDCIVFGIVVNRSAERFADEGEDLWPKRYATWGRLIAGQRDQLAYAIFDAPALDRFIPSLYRPVTANSIPELAKALELDPDALARTVGEFNAAVVDGTYDPRILDDCRTEGLAIPKSHWAQRIEKPPFHAYPLRPGITFTYLGTRVDRTSRMRMADGSAAHNMFAAGEIMAGNVLGKGYLAGIGMTIGSVFGRTAGEEAARHVRN